MSDKKKISDIPRHLVRVAKESGVTIGSVMAMTKLEWQTTKEHAVECDGWYVDGVPYEEPSEDSWDEPHER